MQSTLSMVQRKRRDLIIFVIGLLLGLFASFSTTLYIVTRAIERENSAISTSIRPFHFRGSDQSQLLNNGGWKIIHVFCGDQSHLSDVTTLPAPYFQANQWFSQFRQDEIVSRLLFQKRSGYFVDLAANDAVRISNTYALETFFDWNGLCLEPNPVYWGGLAYRKCHVVAAVVGNETMGEIQFQFPKEKAPKGGIVGRDFDNKEIHSGGETQHRYTVSLSDIFRRFQVPHVIDYLSLDVEGAEDLIVSSFPFLEYRFNILTVERPSDALATILKSNGYLLLKSLKVNTETLWIHSSIQEEVNMAALQIDSGNYKYRETTGSVRIAPEELS